MTCNTVIDTKKTTTKFNQKIKRPDAGVLNRVNNLYDVHGALGIYGKMPTNVRSVGIRNAVDYMLDTLPDSIKSDASSIILEQVFDKPRSIQSITQESITKVLEANGMLRSMFKAMETMESRN